MWRNKLPSSAPVLFDFLQLSNRGGYTVQCRRGFQSLHTSIPMATDDISGPANPGKRKHNHNHNQSVNENNNSSSNEPSSQTDELVSQAQWKPFHGRWQQQPNRIKANNNTHISQQKKKANGKGKGKGNANANANANTSAEPAQPRRSRRVMKAERKAEQDAQKEARRNAQNLKQLGQPSGFDAMINISTAPFGDVNSMSYVGGRGGAVGPATAPTFFPGSSQGHQSLQGLQSLQGPRLPLQFPPQLINQPGLGLWSGNLQQTSAMSTAAEAKSPAQEENTEVEDAGASRNIEQTTSSYPAPVPTAEYMAQASKPPTELTFMQPLLIILDLNGTLLYRKSKKLPPRFVRRPALNHFLERVTARHKVMVWSSAQPATVEAICRQIFTPVQYSKLVAIWSRSHLGLPKDLYRNKVQVYKQLEKVWADGKIQKSYPDKKHKCGKAAHHVIKERPTYHIENEMTGLMHQHWDQSNTVLIDDSQLKGAGNPYNIFEVPEFTNEPNKGDELVLRVLLERIKFLAKSNDVSRRLHYWSENDGQGLTIDRDHILDVASDELSDGSTVSHRGKKQWKEITLSLTAADEKADDKVRRLIRRAKKKGASLPPTPPPMPLIPQGEEETEKIPREKKKTNKAKKNNEDDSTSFLNSSFALSSESESEFAASLQDQKNPRKKKSKEQKSKGKALKKSQQGSRDDDDYFFDD